tara:strand:- start:1166 stop:1717 length:552 start_codon:yes stop_codon:yes gene_type:complete
MITEETKNALISMLDGVSAHTDIPETLRLAKNARWEIIETYYSQPSPALGRIDREWEVDGMGQMVELAERYGYEDDFPDASDGQTYTPRDADALEEAATEFLELKGIQWRVRPSYAWPFFKAPSKHADFIRAIKSMIVDIDEMEVYDDETGEMIGYDFDGDTIPWDNLTIHTETIQRYLKRFS